MGYKAKFGERVASALDLATVAAAIEEEPF
jgi:hypothetical protein